MGRTRLSQLYWQHRIPGHPVQMFTTAVLVQYLSTRYPHAWNNAHGRETLLHHVRNLDKRGIDHG